MDVGPIDRFDRRFTANDVLFGLCPRIGDNREPPDGYEASLLRNAVINRHESTLDEALPL